MVCKLLAHRNTRPEAIATMKRALAEYGYELTGNESTAMLEEMVLVTFSPSGDQFNGLADRAKEAIE